MPVLDDRALNYRETVQQSDTPPDSKEEGRKGKKEGGFKGLLRVSEARRG
jgi:hypothetical protein